MSALSKLFGKKKKNVFKAHCDLSKQPLDKASSYMISTADIVSSKKFWDNKMTEPDTMTYTEAHFKTGDETATNIRRMIFNKFSQEDKVWVIADSEIHLFDIDVDLAKSQADEWWDSEGNYSPAEAGKSLEKLGSDTVEELKNYAIMEAGRKHVAA